MSQWIDGGSRETAHLLFFVAIDIVKDKETLGETLELNHMLCAAHRNRHLDAGTCGPWSVRCRVSD